jgi:hypothetical protein
MNLKPAAQAEGMCEAMRYHGRCRIFEVHVSGVTLMGGRHEVEYQRQHRARVCVRP